MKAGYFLFVLLICMLGYSREKENTIELPLTVKKGYGPFRPAFGGVSFYSENNNNLWIKTRLQVTGIPVDWTDG